MLDIFALKILFYFLAGLVLSAIGTFDMKMIAEERPLANAAASFIGTFVGIIIMADIILEFERFGVTGALSYSIAVAIGSYLAIVYTSKK